VLDNPWGGRSLHPARGTSCGRASEGKDEQGTFDPAEHPTPNIANWDVVIGGSSVGHWWHTSDCFCKCNIITREDRVQDRAAGYALTLGKCFRQSWPWLLVHRLRFQWVIPGLAARRPVAPSSTDAPLAGATHWTPTGEAPLPGGGTLYTYDQNGQIVDYPVPPVGFDPSTATANELSAYGIPQRPPGGQALAGWDRTWGALGTIPAPDVWSVPKGGGAGSTPSSSSHILQAVASFFGTSSSSNWSGYVDRPPVGHQFTEVGATTTQSTAVYTSCPAAQESNWVGLGASELLVGGTNGGLLQDGTSITARSLFGPCAGFGGPCYNAWYEYLSASGSGPNEINLSNVNVKPGDTIYEETLYYTSDKTAEFLVQDKTTNTSQVVELPNAGQYYDGGTGEWVTERPCISGCSTSDPTFAPLFDYQTSKFTSTSITSYKNDVSSGGNVGSYSPTAIDMYDRRSNALMSSPSALSGGSFTDEWHRCS